MKIKQKTKGNWAIEYIYALEYLNKVIIGQNKANQALSACIATYLNQRKIGLDYVAPRIIIQGPSSSGKTTLAIETATYMCTPYSIINGGLVSPEGYRGQSFTDSLKNINPKLGHVLIIDELDKVILKAKTDNFYQTIVFNILAILGGEPIQLTTGEYLESVDFIETKNIMVICCGIFHPLKFNDDPSKNARLLKKFGFSTEFCNRFSHFIAMERLSKNDTQKIIDNLIINIGHQYLSGSLNLHYIPKINRQKILNEIQKPNGLGIRHTKALIQSELEKYYTKNSNNDAFNL